jgi:DNA-binding response OmpR family regulator
VKNLLAGMHILVLEDEFLIAMDVELLCRDHGATAVTIAQDLPETGPEKPDFDAAILDIMIGGESTLPFARKLQEQGIPFIFASGYTDSDEILTAFPDVALIGKPYSGNDLIEAVAEACARRARSGA